MPRLNVQNPARRRCLTIGGQRYTLSGVLSMTAVLLTKKRQDMQLGTILQHSLRRMSGLT
jgi:hypothetical protein